MGHLATCSVYFMTWEEIWSRQTIDVMCVRETKHFCEKYFYLTNLYI